MGASNAALHNPNQNHLLAALPTAEFERLAPHLELVTMSLGEVARAAIKLTRDGFAMHAFMAEYIDSLAGNVSNACAGGSMSKLSEFLGTDDAEALP